MLSPVSFPSFFPPHIHEQGAKSSSSKGRCFSLNWDKVHILGNLIMTISAVVYAYLNKLPPLVMIGFGILGIVTLMSYGAAVKSRPSQREVDYLNDLLDAEKENTKWQADSFKRKLKESGASENLDESLESKLAELERVSARIVRKRAQEKDLDRRLGFKVGEASFQRV